MAGIEILTKAVTYSIKQFSFLFAAFTITNFAFAIAIYHCEITLINTVCNSHLNNLYLTYIQDITFNSFIF